jgi:hypothetical protein
MIGISDEGDDRADIVRTLTGSGQGRAFLHVLFSAKKP